MEYASDGPPAMAADPTQRLLTALGRFQRQVNRAESGAPDHQWIDECMEQLIEGIAISHENDWQDVKEALTDAARILQSYEDAGASSQAVPFLQDSYEILCLMVGDIIVDNVRSGVMNKWRQRYNHALNDLSRHGVTLIDDENSEEAPQPANIVRFAQSAPTAQERAFPFADPDAEIEDDADAVHEETASASPDMHGGIEEAAEEIAAWRAEEEDSDEETLEAEVEDLDAEEAVEDEDDSELDAVDNEVEEESEEETEEDAEEQEIETLALDEDIEEDEEADGEVEEVEAEEETPLPALDEVLFETADADEAEVEVPAAPEPSNVVRLADSARPVATESPDFLFDAPAQTPRVPEPTQAVAAPVRDADDDVQAMLRTAQQAMSRGDVANAKLVALQVAVKMAELEVTRAKDGLRAAEGRLEDTARAIEIASEAVRRTESGVCDVEEQISQRELEFQQRRDQIGALRDEISTVHTNIATIDEQIRALQAQRDLEERNLTGLQDQLEQGLASEERIQADLDMLSQEEEAAREAQDAAKQRVRDLQRERLARESDINDSRNLLKSQERSVEDIQRTLQQVTAGPEQPSQESELLF